MSTKSATQINRRNRPDSLQEEIFQSDVIQDAIETTRKYVRSHPEASALWCFGIGFILGWKLKPW